MCGIVGAVSQRNIVPVLLEGLQRLEYRGYDSCGLAVQTETLQRARSLLRVADLRTQVERQNLNGTVGIAHTRWATHGVPATHNAHPHFSTDANGRDSIAVVHNGIIENHETLRKELSSDGFHFASDTDTEVIVHLINRHYDGCLLDAVRTATKRLRGAYAFVAMSKAEPGVLVGTRQGCPLVAGLGDNENYLASDAMALAASTNQIMYLEDGDTVKLDGLSISVTGIGHHSLKRPVQTVQVYNNDIELAPFQHYMQKEIFEQPRAISDTLKDVSQVSPSLFGYAADTAFQNIEAIQILACGTSYYSGLTAKYWFESLVGLPTNVEIASEYRYREPAVNPRALVIVISQSGETADTLAALKYAKDLGHRHSLAICNVATSAMVRETELAYLTRAGVEIGVASTKAFTTQLVALFLLSLTLAKLRGRLSDVEESSHLKNLRHLPSALQSVLALEPQVIAWAEVFAKKENALFLGRGLHYPIALEGALKLKEISYIHAEAYPAGELKHGPLALVTEEMPVITVAPNDALIEKLKSNMQEVRARGGQLFVFADADSCISPSEGLHVIRLPEHYGLLSPILHVVPMQLLAYHTALLRGNDVDKPRNLAKSVTVE